MTILLLWFLSVEVAYRYFSLRMGRMEKMGCCVLHENNRIVENRIATSTDRPSHFLYFFLLSSRHVVYFILCIIASVFSRRTIIVYFSSSSGEREKMYIQPFLHSLHSRHSFQFLQRGRGNLISHSHIRWITIPTHTPLSLLSPPVLFKWSVCHSV